VNAFYGIYFPITYIFFGLSAWIAKFIPHLWFLPFKATNLIFEFLILILLLKLFPKNKFGVTLLYWLNPWFIILGAWQGFWDSLMGLLLLLSAAVFDEKIKIKKPSFVSGLLIGLAFMVKPQAQSLVLGAFLFFLVKDFIKTKFVRAFNFFSGFIIPFIMFSLYFKVYGQSVFYVAQRLKEVKDIFPVLVGSEVNIWHPISRVVQYFINQPGPIYLPYLDKALISIILYFTLLIMAIIIYLVVLRKNSTLTDVYTISSILLPQIVIMAHANHFYNASLLLFFYIFSNPKIKILWLASVLIHIYSILVRYGFGLGVKNTYLNLNYDPTLTILGIAQFVIVLLFIKEFAFHRTNPSVK